jgi:hypothetical protein
MSQIERVPTGKRYLSDQGLAERYGRTPRTIKRWKKNPKLDFPPADIIINNREYREDTNIEAWERRRIVSAA